MNETPSDKITQLIQKAQCGDHSANENLIKFLYQDLKYIAARHRKKFNNLTINTTGIVHEAWIKINNNQLQFKDRQHFLATASLAIRQLLINDAKKKQSQKRKHQSNTFFSELHGHEDTAQWLIQLDQILTKLTSNQPRLVQVFQMHYFAGLTFQEIAEAMNINVKTVQRDWLKAKYLLATYLA